MKDKGYTRPLQEQLAQITFPKVNKSILQLFGFFLTGIFEKLCFTLSKYANE
jgi:hypothetical protein